MTEITILIVCFLAITAIGSIVDYSSNLKKIIKARKIYESRRLRDRNLIDNVSELIDW